MEIYARNFKINDYFNRIGYSGDKSATLEVLTEIIKKQVKSLAFENCEIWKYKRVVSLETEDIVNKIVYNSRGGYCYELNGLFAMALTQLGFKWYFAAARPMTYPERRPKTHLVVIVEIDNELYLCDSSFGGYTLRAPLKIVDGAETTQENETYNLKKVGNEYVLSYKILDEWHNQYCFELLAQEWIDFSLANYFNATHPATIFTTKKLAMIQTDIGRKFLIDNELKIIENGVITKKDINKDEYEKVLEKEFFIKLS